MKLLGKEIEFYQTAHFNEEIDGLLAIVFTAEALKCLTIHPVDMLVFETKGDILNIRSAGYPLDDPDDPFPDEETVLAKTKSTMTETVWLKIDDYGDKFIGTFMFPEDY
jgi:hypothetical protein